MRESPFQYVKQTAEKKIGEIGMKDGIAWKRKKEKNHCILISLTMKNWFKYLLANILVFYSIKNEPKKKMRMSVVEMQTR